MTPDQHARLREFARRVLYSSFDGALDAGEIVGWAEELDLVETKIATQADIDDAAEDGRSAEFNVGDEIDIIVPWLVEADENEEVGA